MAVLKTRDDAMVAQVVAALLDCNGRTYCEELRIGIEKNTPSALFCWLCAALLFSARISAELAHRAARALIRHGWTTPRKMAEASWADRAAVLNQAGYARYDERTSTMLGNTAELLLHEYDGDLRRLRERAGRDPTAERRLLKQFEGIGDVGADIFRREIQSVWEEQYPFADRKALAAAAKLGIGRDSAALAKLVPRKDFPRLLAALVRTSLAKDYEAVLERARGG
jgi:endonuclease III